MSYYKHKFDSRGFDTMFAFLQMGKQQANIPTLKKAIQDLITMMKQKSGGRSKEDISIEENFDMTIITIVCESIALYLSGSLNKLENIVEQENIKIKETNYMENNKMNETDIKRFIEMFNRDFKCKIQNNNFSFLIDLFENFINQEISDPCSNRILYDKLEILDEKITKKLEVRDKNLFEEWNKLQDDYLLDIAEQSFIYGFCVCKQLEKETRTGGDKDE